MSSPKSPVRKKKKDHTLELAMTWAAGLLVLLTANMTLFRYYEASVGDPWFNYLIGAAVVVLLFVISRKVQRLRHDIKLANSQISRIDGMDAYEFALYIKEITDKEGWEEAGITIEPFGAVLQLARPGEQVQVVLHTGKRKLTREFVATVGEHCGQLVSSQGSHAEANGVWCITNASFTAQGRREAAALGLKLVDRGGLIDGLAKTPNVPFIPGTDRRR